MTDFRSLGLAQPTLKALAAKDYDTPTPIQAQAIPPLLEGHDLLGIAQTGTGKTAAFSLPSIDRLVESGNRRTPRSCRMLILAPTRELAAQIQQSIFAYARYTPITSDTAFGGVPIGRQIKRLAQGVDVLVATPGRLLDLIDQRALTLNAVEIFVLDEADQMMDLGFIHPLRRVSKLLPKQRQTLFFSATMPKEIADLAKEFLTDPVKVSVTPPSTTAERIAQSMTLVDQREKQALLNHILKSEPIERALVFTRTKHGADRVVRHLMGAGIRAAAIHGNKSQAQRTHALGGFKDGSTPVLVATDIAARGIDVSGVSHVINFEIPDVAEQYVHRIGRTARAGAEGIAISLVADDERQRMRAVERLTGVKPNVVPLPANFVEMVARMPKPVAPPRDTGSQGRDPHRQREEARGGRGGGRPQREGGGDRFVRDGERSGDAQRPRRFPRKGGPRRGPPEGVRRLG